MSAPNPADQPAEGHAFVDRAEFGYDCSCGWSGTYSREVHFDTAREQHAQHAADQGKGAKTPAARCTHWRVCPGLIDVQCTREAGHPSEPERKSHINGPESWNDTAGEWREVPACEVHGCRGRWGFGPHTLCDLACYACLRPDAADVHICHQAPAESPADVLAAAGAVPFADETGHGFEIDLSPAESPAGDVEALGRLLGGLLEADGNTRYYDVGGSGRRAGLKMAQAILASDWLARHDEKRDREARARRPVRSTAQQEAEVSEGFMRGYDKGTSEAVRRMVERVEAVIRDHSYTPAGCPTVTYTVPLRAALAEIEADHV